jgi:hypothetical protein
MVLCGDINVNNLIDSNRKQALDSMLLSYNLSSTVNFPTRTLKNSCTAIDNTFVENSVVGVYSVSPLINGLSDHEAQLLEIKDIDLQAGNKQYQTLQKIDKRTIAEFVTKLSYESWDTLFDSINTDSKFN